MLCIVTMTLKVVIQYVTNVMYRDYDPQSSYPICEIMLCIVTMTLKVVIQYATNVMYRDYDPQSSYPICDQCYVS